MKNQKSKQLTVGDLVGYGVGNCIGSGIFVYMGLAIGFTGRSVSIAMLVASFAMLFAYAYNTLLAGTLPLSGGKYAQSAVLQPPLLAGVSAVTQIIKSMAISGFAISIVKYAKIPFPQLEAYESLIAFVIMTLFFLSTIKGTKFMAKLNMIMVLVMVVSLTVFIVVGVPQVQPGAFSFNDSEYFSGGPLGFACAVAVMGIACQGSTMLVSYASDAKKPTRSIPIAILITTVIVGILYMLIAVVASGVLPVSEVANQSLAVVSKVMFPYPVFLIFILGGACFAIATSLYGTISSLKYPILSAVEDGWFPEFIGKKTKNGYPWVTMLITYFVGVLPIVCGMGLDQIASYLMIPIMFLSMLNNILFLKIPKKYPNAWKRSFFHMPMPALIVVIILSMAADLLVCAAMFTTLGKNDKIIVPALMIIIFLYSYFRMKSGKVSMKSVEEARRQAMEEINETEKL